MSSTHGSESSRDFFSRRTVAWFRADPRRMVVSEEADREVDLLLAARAAFRRAAP